MRPPRNAPRSRARKFQSTHPSGVRHPPNNNQPSLHISIHAPQWGATESRRGREGQGRISIHAPQWGATPANVLIAVISADFNPRTPVGCDSLRLASLVSIMLFQSTHPSGVRQDGWKSVPAGGVFQSTHPSGVRHIGNKTMPTVIGNFNPRTPVGCDSIAWYWTNQ